MKKNQEIVTNKGNYDISVPKQMVQMAGLLKGHIIKHSLYTNISGKNYAHVEGWQFAGGLMGSFPRVVDVENLSTKDEIKWKAEVEVINLKTGNIISRGFALCSNKENKKKSFDEYAVLSMAQTRAIGKAYRNVIGWVMKLAGYETTPSEEMARIGEHVGYTPTPQKDYVPTPVIEAECHECGNPITKQEAEYSKKMFKKQLCRDCQKFARK